MSMLRAERGNVVLDIKAEDANFYLEKGYDIFDGKELIMKAPPTTIAEFKKLLLERDAKIAELERRIEALVAESKKPKTRAKKKED